MEVSREELTQQFESLSDQALSQHLRSGTLTPLASEVANDILRSRSVDPESFSSTADEIDNQDLDLVTVSVQWDPLNANLLRALLESHGVFAHVWGEHLATTHIFLSNAGGGSRVMVRSDQVAQARELMGAFERGELAAPDLPDEDADATSEQTTPSRPYSFPSNPYIPSPAAIETRATDQPAPRPIANRFPVSSPEPQAHPRADQSARVSSGPLRKISILIAVSAIVLALWLVFTH